MSLIKIVCNPMDIQPTTLICNFLRYLGLYCVISENDSLKKINSICDIYIITDSFMENNRLEVTEEYYSQTIFICCDRYHIDKCFPSVEYLPYQNKEFLSHLIVPLSKIVYGKPSPECEKILEAYCSNNLLFTDCILSKINLLDKYCTKRNYETFINELLLYPELDSSYVIRQAILCAKYKFDCFVDKCNAPREHFFYSVFDLIDECDKLLKKFPNNLSLYFIKADIKYRFLKDNFSVEEYSNRKIAFLPEACYKRAFFFCSIFEEYEYTKSACNAVIEKSPSYYKAWYELGCCLMKIEKYSDAIKSFLKIRDILKMKFDKNELCPDELIILHKSVIKITFILKCFLFKDSAYAYFEFSETIKEKVEELITGYVTLISKENSPELISDLGTSIKSNLFNKKFKDIL